jgi:hypothetical protein
MAAGKIATAAFFAPVIFTSPRSGCPPLITSFSINELHLPFLFKTFHALLMKADVLYHKNPHISIDRN